jgi:hypothetical protein
MEGKGDKYALDGCPKTIKQYKAEFQKAATKVIGEISPSYFSNPSCLSQIKETIPDIKIGVVLRNPIDKAYSQYMHLVREGREGATFGEALSQEDSRREARWSDFWLYKSSSLYAETVREVISVFSRDSWLFLFQENFRSKPQYQMEMVEQFLSLTHHNYDFSQEYNASGKPKSLVLAKLLAPGPLLRVLKFLIPISIGAKIKSIFSSFNMGSKPMLDEDLKDMLRKYFTKDVWELQEILNLETPWPDFDGKKNG